VAWRAPVRNLAKDIDLNLVNVDPGADPELFANAMLGSGEFQSGLAHGAPPYEPSHGSSAAEPGRDRVGMRPKLAAVRKAWTG